MLTLRLIAESFAFAWKALRSNLLRTVLSLLGVTIGIFSIIAVLTLVDSLEKNIKDSLNFLGTNVIYVDKWPFVAEGDGNYKWWEYWRRPCPSLSDFRFLQTNLKNYNSMSIFASKSNVIVRRENNSIGQIELTGGGQGYENIFDLKIENGRYFTGDEVEAGKNITLLGFEVAKALFPNGNIVGETVKIQNLKYTIIGVLKKEGESFMGWSSNDYSVIIPYNSLRKLYLTGTGAWNELQSTIGIKGEIADVGLVELENELRGLLRIRRGLQPLQKDSFALNRPEAIMNLISGVFDVFSVGGWIIGGFSMLVGGFGIANIMFVSVKERTVLSVCKNHWVPKTTSSCFSFYLNLFF